MTDLLPQSTVRLIEDVPAVGRKLRSPKHRHQIRQRPWHIQPFMIAPVLPGDTLERIDLQAIAVTDGLVSPLLGWWLEHQYYYISFSALEYAESAQDSNEISKLKALLLDPAATLTGTDYNYVTADSAAAKPELMFPLNFHGYDFVDTCLATVRAAWFRDEEEGLTGIVGNLPVARIRPPGQNDWSESLLKDSLQSAVPVYTDDADGVKNVDDPYFKAYVNMRELSLLGADVTYEDWLRDQGIRAPRTDAYRGVPVPELLRATRSWKKPSVTPGSDGSIASRVIWDVNEDATKKRFFKEPGFIFGVCVARPKVYLSTHTMPAVNALMTSPLSWMPKALQERPELALRKFTQTTGPLNQATAWGDYWVDVVDLFVHGDDFLNFALTATDAGLVALPGAALTKDASHYPTSAMMDAVFEDAAGGYKYIRQDGVTQLRILSRLRDRT